MDIIRLIILALALAVAVFLCWTFSRFLMKYRFWKMLANTLMASLIYLSFRLFVHWGGIGLGDRAGKWVQSLGVFLAVFLLLKAVEGVVFIYLVDERVRSKIPNLLRGMIRWLLAVTLLFIILHINLKVDLTPLIATSAALTFVVGMAMQDVLGNLFAGLALNIEKPFSLGDWVMINQKTGLVMDMSWRATRIKTFSDNYVIIPNSEISKDEIINYSHPTTIHARELKVGVSYSTPPNKVKELMALVMNETPEIMKKPEPRVWLVEYGDFAIIYRMKFWIDGYSHLFAIEDSLMSRLWYIFQRNDIQIPFPIRDVRIRQEAPSLQEGEIFERLKNLPLFDSVPEREIRILSVGLKPMLFARGEILVRQGDPGNSLFVIEKGSVSAYIRDRKGRQVPVTHLEQGMFFGDFSLLTGSPRRATITADSDTVVFEIEKERFAPILEKNARIAEKLSKNLEEHQRQDLEAMERSGTKASFEGEPLSSNKILQNIKNFFGLKKK